VVKLRSLGAGAALAVVLVATACQPADPFHDTSPMRAPRAGHTATLLSTGRVLVLGGAAAGQPSAERYDPGSGTWVVRAGMRTPRSGHRATRLASGKVLVTGGRSTATGTLLTSAEVYDPADDRWAAAAATPFAGGHSTTLLPNGKVLAVFTDERTRGWLYDPAANAWTPTAPKRTTAWRTATTLPGGTALVVGGDTIPSTATTYGASRAERFDPATGQWAQTGSAPYIRASHATTLGDGTVMAMGYVLLKPGSYFESSVRTALYDARVGTWAAGEHASECDNMLGEGLTLTGLGDASALTAGRTQCVDSTNPSARRVRATEFVALDGFAERDGHAAVQLSDGRVLITGGRFGHHDNHDPDCCRPFEVRATAELFTP
jgi:hypothetical protein